MPPALPAAMAMSASSKWEGVTEIMRGDAMKISLLTLPPSFDNPQTAANRHHPERFAKRRIKTQTVLPPPATAVMLFWALLASGQSTMRKVDGWQTLATKPTDAVIDLAA